MLAALFGASTPTLHRFYLSFCRLCLRVVGTKLSVGGADRVRPGEAYVVVANHASNWDPICIIVALPALPLRFIAKQAIMRIPILGHTLRLTGNVTVLRTETSTDVERIRGGMEQRDPRVSLLFFAEGTRSRDGALHPFKMGAFASAIGAGLPILPVAIAGSAAVWPPGSVPLYAGPVVVEVGEPIATEGLGPDDRRALRDQCFAAVSALHVRARARLGSDKPLTRAATSSGRPPTIRNDH